MKLSSHNGRTVGLPRGLLRFLVLNMLREKPLSGTEIVEQIEKQTEGKWKPSPGSIYPLLAWLSDKGYTKELPKDQDGLKRYCFTELGTEFLKKQLVIAKDFQKKIEFLAPLLVRGLPIGVNQEKFNDIVPLMMIPDMEEEELISKINLSIEEGKTIDHYIPEMGIFEDEDILT